MSKWSIRDLWGRLTQKKQLNPEMRSMLLNLEGVYDPRAPGDSAAPADGEVDEEHGSADARR